MKNGTSAKSFIVDTFSAFDEAFLDRVFNERRVATGCASSDDYRVYLDEDPTEMDALKTSLHVGYSEFFRNSLSFVALEKLVIPLALKKLQKYRRSELRVWCAGCASGQEPYSVAIMLEELNEVWGNAGYRIFATDSDEERLREAKGGLFTEVALKNVSLQRLQRWFSHKSEGYEVKPVLTDRIDFSLFDLLGHGKSSPPSSIFGGFDLILCCNVLIYYNPVFRKIILNKLARSLRRGAFLVVGETERGFVRENGFYEVFPCSAIFQQFPLSRKGMIDD